jgi:hypothetical protein
MNDQGLGEPDAHLGNNAVAVASSADLPPTEAAQELFRRRGQTNWGMTS